MEENQIQDLISRSKQGDTKAFGKLVVAFQPLVFQLSFRLLCNDDDARDMVQEVFIKAWLKLDRYTPSYRFSTWLYKITCNMCYDQLRFRLHSPESTGIPLSVVEHSALSCDDMETSFINRELKELILYFTDKLSPKQKTIFILSDIEELEAEEIEKITGLSAGQIKSNLHLARKKIREKINAITS
jgi:RNA polymerase sigma-70 factor (ECF subfamily)